MKLFGENLEKKKRNKRCESDACVRSRIRIIIIGYYKSLIAFYSTPLLNDETLFIVVFLLPSLFLQTRHARLPQAFARRGEDLALERLPVASFFFDDKLQRLAFPVGHFTPRA